MKQWLCRTQPEASVRILQQELRMGGALRLEVTGADGTVYKLTSAYREVRPPERLAFTWNWAHEPNAPESLVTVEFRALGESATEVFLVHEPLTGQSREGTNRGWVLCFDMLDKALAS